MHRHSLILGLGSLAAVLLAQGTADAAALRKGPYLLWDGDNTAMTVMWQTDTTPTTGSTIEWGTTVAYGNGPISITESGNGTDEHQFAHTLTGLTPGSRVYYRVSVDGAGVASSFLAAPSASATAVTIFAYGDSRSQPLEHDRVCGQVLADIDTAPDVRQTMITHSGDWMSSGDSEAAWDDEYFDANSLNTVEMLSRIPVMGCRGNHEGSGALLRKYWPYPYVDGSGYYYSFDFGPVHVAVIDQYINYSVGSPQYTWLEQDLTSSVAPWKVALFHEPAYGAGGGHANNTTTQSVLVPLFESTGVSLVLAGHNHYYARCEVNGIQHVTVGSAGAPLYTPDTSYPYVVAAESTYHYVRLDFGLATATMTTVRGDGSIIETLTLNRVLDETPPTVTAVAATDAQHVHVTFSEPVEAGTGTNGAENVANYTVAGFTVTGATLVSPSVVELTLGAAMTEGTPYSVEVTSVADRASPAHVMAASSHAFTYYAAPVTVIQPGDTWHYFKGTSAAPDEWATATFDDSTWLSGPTGIGYGDGDDATVLSDMQNSYLTVYLRRSFDVADASTVAQLTFTVDYDDGFVAYLNNTEVARRGVASGQNEQTTASSHEAGSAEVIDLSSAIPNLVDGTNVLAIEVHNTSLGSSDLSMIPTLTMLGGTSAPVDPPPIIPVDPPPVDPPPTDGGGTTDGTTNPPADTTPASSVRSGCACDGSDGSPWPLALLLGAVLLAPRVRRRRKSAR